MSDSDTVVVPREALKQLVAVSSRMLAEFAAMGKQRPSKDYEAVYGGPGEVFLGLHEELQDEEMAQVQSHSLRG